MCQPMKTEISIQYYILALCRAPVVYKGMTSKSAEIAV